MGLHLDPFEYRAASGTRHARTTDLVSDWKVATHGIEVIAHGALVCPDCKAPVVVANTTPVQAMLDCGYCGHSDRARAFLRRNVFDTVKNEAYLIARLR